MAAGLVNSINAVNTMTASMLNTASMKGYFAAANAMQAGQTALSTLANRGMSELIKFGIAWAAMERADTGVTEDVIGFVLNDPRLPSSNTGMLVVVIDEIINTYFDDD
jgi:hypothetical protein